jgi:hypothetical protein
MPVENMKIDAIYQNFKEQNIADNEIHQALA